MFKKKITITFIAVSLFLGILFQSKIEAFAKSRYEDLQLFAKVLNLVQEYYVEPVDMKKLIYGGIKGMLKELDPHTNFMPPEIYEERRLSKAIQCVAVEVDLRKRPTWRLGFYAKPGQRVPRR